MSDCSVTVDVAVPVCLITLACHENLEWLYQSLWFPLDQDLKWPDSSPVCLVDWRWAGGLICSAEPSVAQTESTSLKPNDFLRNFPISIVFHAFTRWQAKQRLSKWKKKFQQRSHLCLVALARSVQTAEWRGIWWGGCSGLFHSAHQNTLSTLFKWSNLQATCCDFSLCGLA